MVTHESGLSLWYTWDGTRCRKPARFRSAPSGGLVALDRHRRGDLRARLSGLFQMGDSLPRGPRPGKGLATNRIVVLIDELQARGVSVPTACEEVGAELGYNAETVRVKYYTQRRMLWKARDHTPVAATPRQTPVSNKLLFQRLYERAMKLEKSGLSLEAAYAEAGREIDKRVTATVTRVSDRGPCETMLPVGPTLND